MCGSPDLITFSLILDKLKFQRSPGQLGNFMYCKIPHPPPLNGISTQEHSVSNLLRDHRNRPKLDCSKMERQPTNAGYVEMKIILSTINTLEHHVSCTDAKISVRINLLFYLFFHRRPIQQLFISCRPFVVNTFSTDFVGVEVSSVSWLRQLAVEV